MRQHDGVIDWGQLSAFDQLALLVHHPESEQRFMGLTVVSYADESENAVTPGIYVVSGLLSTSHEWYELGRKWRAALKKAGIEQWGFHMAPSEQRNEAPYIDMERPQRQALQRVFIDLIVGMDPLWGFATGIAQDRYKDADILEPAKTALGPWHKPYYFCFKHTVEWMANEVEEGGFPRGERIAFIFDQQKEYSGNAKVLYDQAQQQIENGHRLGHLGFDSRMNAVQLQAADIWAYESQRMLRGMMLGQVERRPQFTRLAGADSSTSRFRLKFLSSEGVEELARGRGWIP